MAQPTPPPWMPPQRQQSNAPVAGPWPPYGHWQQPQGGWVWSQNEQPEIGKKPVKKRAPKQVSSESSEDSSDDSDEKEKKKKKKKEKGRNWEKETPKQRSTRHKKYEKMSETADTDKQSIKHQVSAMYKSIIAQEKVVKHLRAALQHEESEDQRQELKDLLEEVIAARKELVARTTYLEVAYDYDWEAAKVFLEMRESNPSSIVLKAVTEAKKRKAATKSVKETEEKKKKKVDCNNNSHGGSNSNSNWRNYPHQPHYHHPTPQYWNPMLHGAQAAPYFQQPASPYPPATPYGRQAAGGYRPPRPPGCFTCGEANHGFRRCPNASRPPPPPQESKPPPPPPT